MKIRKTFLLFVLFVFLSLTNSCERCFSFYDETSFQITKHIAYLFEFYCLRN